MGSLGGEAGSCAGCKGALCSACMDRVVTHTGLDGLPPSNRSICPSHTPSNLPQTTLPAAAHLQQVVVGRCRQVVAAGQRLAHQPQRVLHLRAWGAGRGGEASRAHALVLAYCWPICWPAAPRVGVCSHVLATAVRQLQPQRTCCPATSVPSNSDTVWPVGRAVAHCMGRAGSGQLVRALCGAGAAVG